MSPYIVRDSNYVIVYLTKKSFERVCSCGGSSHKHLNVFAAVVVAAAVFFSTLRTKIVCTP